LYHPAFHGKIIKQRNAADQEKSRSAAASQNESGGFNSRADILVDEELDAGLDQLVPVPILDTGGGPAGVFNIGVIGHI